MQTQLLTQITQILKREQVATEEPMSRHTTFRIGGKADVLVTPESIEQVINLVQLFQKEEVPFFVLGNGSNILVGDRGIRGAVIQLGNAFSDCEIMGNTMVAKSGIKLSRLANLALEHGLTGLEFAAGIPGTLGGAIYMNAGAYGGEMKQVIVEVTYLDETGKLKTVSAQECEFGYRTSLFSQTSGCVILECKIQLQPGDPIAIRETMNEFAQRRTSKQPLHLPSAGSTFKRPEGHFAGKLIQDADLMGFRFGGASVSTKHAGFVVNDQGATAAEVRELMRQVQERVETKFGVKLEPEVKFIGEFYEERGLYGICYHHRNERCRKIPCGKKYGGRGVLLY